MTTPTPPPPPPRPAALLPPAAALLALAALAALACNLLRHPSSRLPWNGHWNDYIETRALSLKIPTATMPLVASRLRQNPPPVLLDARPHAAFAAGHLPHARSLPYQNFAALFPLAAAENLWNPQTPFLLYCDSTDCEDALLLAQSLRNAGFPNVTLYAGGWNEWSRAGAPTETTPAP